MSEHLDPDSLVVAMSPLTKRAVARRLGISAAVLCRPLSIAQADRYATALGLHPVEVWGTAYSRPQRRQRTRTVNTSLQR